MTDFIFANRRYLALWFPYLPADRLRRQPDFGLAPETPLAFIEKVKSALEAGGGRPGGAQPGPGAGHDPGRRPGARARAGRRSIATKRPTAIGSNGWPTAAIRYTPMVALDAPDGLILDVTGCTHLFGGERGLAADVEARMARLRMTVRLAFAEHARRGPCPGPLSGAACEG